MQMLLVASACADTARVALHGGSAALPYSSEWVTAWYGVYEADDERPPLHLPQPSSSFGRRVYLKSDDATKVLWYTERRFWHFGHPEDIATGAGMIAVQSEAATPEEATEGWRIVVHGQVRWQPVASLRVVPAPPRVLYLHGHGPPELRATGGWLSRGWLEAYLGVYESTQRAEHEEDELANGMPVYRRHGCDEPCEQLLWFGVCSARHTPCWIVGAASGLGDSPGTPSDAGRGVGGRDGHDQQSDEGSGGARLVLESALPHTTNGTWYVRGGAHADAAAAGHGHGLGGRTSWVAAPGLACTADASEVRGFFASALAARIAEQRVDEWLEEHARYAQDDGGGWLAPGMAPGMARWLVWALEALAASMDAAAEAAGDVASGAVRWVSELLETALWPGGIDAVGQTSTLSSRPLAAKLPAWVAQRVQALSWAWNTLQQSHVSLSSVLTTCGAWVVLVLLDFWRRQRWRDAADDDDEDGAEGTPSEALAEDSSEEKKLAFACLSEAIEDVKASITEQQYMSLYSAALWTFNLTPAWAEGRPMPPDRPGGAPEAASAAAAAAAVAAASAAESSEATGAALAAEAASEGAPSAAEPLMVTAREAPKRRRARRRRPEQPTPHPEEELVFATTW